MNFSLPSVQQLVLAVQKLVLAPVFAAAMAGPALAANPQLTKDENLVVDYWQSRGVERMLLLNESRGKIMAIENGQIIFTGNALSGKVKGDRIDQDDRVTPAGIFPLNPVGTANDPYIIFKEFGRVTYSIHPTIQARGQHRDERMQSNLPGDKRISAGCVNVPPADFQDYLKFVWGEKQTYQDMDGVYKYANVMVVLPEQTSVRKFFHIPDDFQPKP